MAGNEFHFSTMQDVAEYVAVCLGENVGDFDVMGIAADIVTYRPGRGFYIRCDEDEFWAAVLSHDVSVKAGC